ncbi:MAG: isoprenylcysteine carboxylmethyltransferase family protein [Smithellaceae bacterium]|nr:isoprenylcysteine carboxylmethyltransferase family protein [Smithellaceae bacterium]
MVLRWLTALVALPGMVVIFIPALIIWSTTGWQGIEVAGPGVLSFWAAVIVGTAGFALSARSSSLFKRFGEGTPAPWDPPRHFVVRGPYRYVRNPMIMGVVLMLIAESLLLQSWYLACWAGIFFMGNAIYFPLVEEKGLKKRFGVEYEEYCRHVSRWLPRLTPWEPGKN